jgi:hypothetical protein
MTSFKVVDIGLNCFSWPDGGQKEVIKRIDTELSSVVEMCSLIFGTQLNQALMKNKVLLSIAFSIILGIYSASAQATWAPVSTFGNNGWLAPGNSGLVTGTTDRGLAAVGGYVYYASGSQAFEIDPNTGALIGGLATGFSGGTLAVDQLAAGSDGTLYVGNLTTSGSSPFKLYSYANPTSLATAPTVYYSSNPGGGSTRLGDSLAATGGGSSITLAVGSGAGAGGYTVINGGAGTAVGVSGTLTPGFNKAITFVNPSQVIGLTSAGTYYNTTFAGTVGTLVGGSGVSIPDPNGNTSDRILSYNVLGGEALLAVQSTGDSHVTLYDMTSPNGPVYLGTLNQTVSPGANSNGTGEMAWGPATYNGLTGTWSETLYTLSSGQGFQAFIVTVPEPGAGSLAALGLGLLAFWRKLRK